MLLIAVAAGLALKAEVTVGRREVRVDQLVRIDREPGLPGAEASRIVLRLPIGRRHWDLPAPALRRLVERQLPGRSVAGAGRVAITLVVPASARVQTTCWTVARAIPAGASVTRRDVAPTACRDAAVVGPAVGALAFGVDHGPTAMVDLSEGTRLGRLLPAAPGRIASARPLSLRIAAGPVTIERPVTTLQPGRSGRRLFVRDAEGHVFAAALALADDAR